MPDEEEKEKGFKVQDRRRFSPEGEARENVPEREETPASAAPPNPQEDLPNAGEQAQAHDAYTRASTTQASAADEPEDITFVGFVLSLSTEALALLGEMPHPATGEKMRDLRGAQQFIDILGVLREKTRGNLSSEEDSLMERVLFDLRMKYVEIARQVR